VGNVGARRDRPRARGSGHHALGHVQGVPAFSPEHAGGTRPGASATARGRTDESCRVDHARDLRGSSPPVGPRRHAGDQCDGGRLPRRRHPSGHQGAHVEGHGQEFRCLVHAHLLLGPGRNGHSPQYAGRHRLDRQHGELAGRRDALADRLRDPGPGLLLRPLLLRLEYGADRRHVLRLPRGSHWSRHASPVRRPGLRLHRKSHWWNLALRLRSCGGHLRLRLCDYGRVVQGRFHCFGGQHPHLDRGRRRRSPRRPSPRPRGSGCLPCQMPCAS